MIFSFHNKLEVKTKNSTYEFYNTILNSTLIQLSNFQKYNEHISLGNGESNPEIQQNFHLTNYLYTLKLQNYSMQSDISKGNLFAKYEYLLNPKDINSSFITELGLSDNGKNPKIFNYFSLISNETPNGIEINDLEEIAFEITINLTINESSLTLTSGNNPLIEFFLGNGIDKVFISNGTNYSSNERINRELSQNNVLFPCKMESIVNDNSLVLSFSQKLNIGEIDEILFITNNRVFARQNLKEFNPTITNQISLMPKENYVIKINDDIKNINSIINTSTQTEETDYYVSKYANSFGDKISLPFNNLFTHQTSRFISKDSKLLFFLINDKVYGYKNLDYSIIELDTSQIKEDNILKIISFENFVFVISKIFPYISTYLIENKRLIKCNNNFSSIDNIEKLNTYLQIDITLCKNNNFILGIICENKSALSIYFQYNKESGFNYKSQISNNKEFHYLLAMYKNNFCDGQMIYLKEGENSAECRIITHSSTENETDVYSPLAYHLTKDAVNISCKDRAIISQKSTTPSLVIYYYPQIYEYNLPLISNEINDYISGDLNYIIQEHNNKQYSVYNIVGYDKPEIFFNELSDIVDASKIQDFEFLNDSLLIFLDDINKPVITVNLNLNKTQIQNLSTKNINYDISYNKYNKLGSNNEVVLFSLSTRINLWFFLKEYTN